MTVEDLLRIFRTSAGESEYVKLDEAVLDTGFDALGYDSLALLEVTAQIKREFGVQLEDDAVFEAKTPRQLLSLVNGL